MKSKEIRAELVHPVTREILGTVEVEVKIEDNYLEECGPDGKDERWRKVYVYAQIAHGGRQLKKGEFGFDFF